MCNCTRAYIFVQLHQSSNLCTSGVHLHQNFWCTFAPELLHDTANGWQSQIRTDTALAGAAWGRDARASYGWRASNHTVPYLLVIIPYYTSGSHKEQRLHTCTIWVESIKSYWGGNISSWCASLSWGALYFTQWPIPSIQSNPSTYITSGDSPRCYIRLYTIHMLLLSILLNSSCKSQCLCQGPFGLCCELIVEMTKEKRQASVSSSSSSLSNCQVTTLCGCQGHWEMPSRIIINHYSHTNYKYIYFLDRGGGYLLLIHMLQRLTFGILGKIDWDPR